MHRGGALAMAAPGMRDIPGIPGMPAFLSTIPR